MKKHAYLIIAHQHFDLLGRLIKALDSEAADFYIHIDRRVRDFDAQKLLSCLKKSKGQIFRRYKITWGADTQVRCEMLLLEKAAQKGYDYYHLLSGIDIPLRSHEQIEAFFEGRDESFIEVKAEGDRTATMDRARYYYPLQNLIGRPVKDPGFVRGVLDQLSYELMKAQRLLGMDRTKDAPFVYCRGGNWFSITHELAEHVVRSKKTVRRYFYHALTSDEMFLQCIAMASPYREKIVRDNLRLIDWQRAEMGGCSPHTFTMQDLPALLGSDKLWARKFDPNIDREVIEALYGRIERRDDPV